MTTWLHCGGSPRRLDTLTVGTLRRISPRDGSVCSRWSCPVPRCAPSLKPIRADFWLLSVLRKEAVHVVLLAGRRRSGAAGLVVKRGNVLARGPIDGETSLAVVGQIGPWGRAEAAFVEIERTGGSVVPRITGPDQSPPSEITRMPMWGLNRDGRRFVIDAAGVPLTP
jgi:hypothetical protein